MYEGVYKQGQISDKYSYHHQNTQLYNKFVMANITYTSLNNRSLFIEEGKYYEVGCRTSRLSNFCPPTVDVSSP